MTTYQVFYGFLVLTHNDHVHIQLVIDKVVRSPEKLCGFPRTRMPEEVIWQLSRTDFCYIKKIHNIMNESLLRRVAPPIFRCFYGKKYFARILLREPMGMYTPSRCSDIPGDSLAYPIPPCLGTIMVSKSKENLMSCNMVE